MPLKLRQGQVWKHGHEFVRIVRLERLEVAYKTSKKLRNDPGEHHVTSKKDFCRLLKECRLLGEKSERLAAESEESSSSPLPSPPGKGEPFGGA